jgi:CubicO group peptidase (beta-lactamase class C family)
MKDFQEIVDSYAVSHQFSGVVRIKQGEFTVYEGAFGYASKPFRIPNKMDVKFGTASITKMLTSLGILKLVETGQVNLTDLLSKYLQFNDSTLDSSITIEQLLTHTSGIADYFDTRNPEGFEKLWGTVPSQYIDRLDKMLPLFIDETPDSRPGEQFAYSGAGFILLGLIIEKVTGMDYYEYMREEVFKKHYLFDTDFIPLQHVCDNVAQGYMPIKNEKNHLVGWQQNIFAVPAYGLSDGGAFSTARDMIKFMRMLRDYSLVSEDVTNMWLKPRVKVEEGLYYGLGIWLAYDEHGELFKYGHTGEDPGVSARVYHYPKQNIDLVLFSNHGFSTSSLLSELEENITSGKYDLRPEI